ncbi:MAG: VWA domain-containing protein, partial [Nitrospira sp.]|nr:VWA domain-containing protein [Nitrospira sp.]
EGITITELIVESLFRLSTGESLDAAAPRAIKGEVDALWTLCQPLFQKGATAEDAVRLTDVLYRKVEEVVASYRGLLRADSQKDRIPDEREAATSVSVVSEQPTDMYRPLENHAYRGEMRPEFVTWEGGRSKGATLQGAEERETTGQKGSAPGRSGAIVGADRKEHQSEESGLPTGGPWTSSVVEELLAVDGEEQLDAGLVASAQGAVRYPEWDHAIRDYRLNRCRVVERPAEVGADEVMETILVNDRSMIASLRKLFESLRPTAYRRVPGETDGEDPDLDAVVRRAADLRAGQEGSERVYIRHDKRDRSVAAAFLVDVSGSTSRRLDSGRRVIDVEKESLVLLCEAVEAMGDQYGLYAYSGNGAAAVDFIVIKDFDDRWGAATVHRLGALSPQRQNRDGAAIRHASAKLLKRNAKHRLLILLSDGRPLDGEDYKDDYAVEDTKRALQEARWRGIVPFCVTIDQEASEYQRRMYGDERFVVIDRVEWLPMRLPTLYRRLTA